MISILLFVVAGSGGLSAEFATETACQSAVLYPQVWKFA